MPAPGKTVPSFAPLALLLRSPWSKQLHFGAKLLFAFTMMNHQSPPVQVFSMLMDFVLHWTTPIAIYLIALLVLSSVLLSGLSCAGSLISSTLLTSSLTAIYVMSFHILPTLLCWTAAFPLALLAGSSNTPTEVCLRSVTIQSRFLTNLVALPLPTPL